MKRHDKRILRPVTYLLVGYLSFLLIWSVAGKELQARWNYLVYSGTPEVVETEDSAEWLDEILQTNEDQETNEDSEESEIMEGTLYASMTCEEIQLSAPVYYGDGEEELLLGVGQYPNGIFPGDKGTLLYGAHDSTYFASLADIEIGDVITVSVNDQEYDYEVTDTAVMDADKFELPQGDSEEMILYTCYPIGEQVGSQRLFVYCERI